MWNSSKLFSHFFLVFCLYLSFLHPLVAWHTSSNDFLHTKCTYMHYGHVIHCSHCLDYYCYQLAWARLDLLATQISPFYANLQCDCKKNSIKIQSHTFIESAQRAKHALWLRSTNNELSRHRSLSSHAYQHSVEFSTNRKRKQSVRLLQRPSILFHCYGYIIPLLF